MGHPRTPAREIMHLHGPDPLQSLWAEGTNYCCRGSEPERGRIRDLEGQGRSNVSSLGQCLFSSISESGAEEVLWAWWAAPLNLSLVVPWLGNHQHETEEGGQCWQRDFGPLPMFFFVPPVLPAVLASPTGGSCMYLRVSRCLARKTGLRCRNYIFT